MDFLGHLSCPCRVRIQVKGNSQRLYALAFIDTEPGDQGVSPGVCGFNLAMRSRPFKRVLPIAIVFRQIEQPRTNLCVLV